MEIPEMKAVIAANAAVARAEDAKVAALERRNEQLAQIRNSDRSLKEVSVALENDLIDRLEALLGIEPSSSPVPVERLTLPGEKANSDGIGLKFIFADGVALLLSKRDEPVTPGGTITRPTYRLTSDDGSASYGRVVRHSQPELGFNNDLLYVSRSSRTPGLLVEMLDLDDTLRSIETSLGLREAPVAVSA